MGPSDLDLDSLHLLIQFDDNGRAMNYGGVIEIRRVFDEDYQVPASEEEWQRWRSSGIQIGDDLSKVGMFRPSMFLAVRIPGSGEEMTSVSADVRAGAPTGERVLAYRLDKSRKVDWMAVLYMDGSSAEMVGNAPEIRLGSK